MDLELLILRFALSLCRVVLQGNIIGICDIDEEKNRRLRFY